MYLHADRHHTFRTGQECSPDVDYDSPEYAHVMVLRLTVGVLQSLVPVLRFFIVSDIVTLHVHQLFYGCCNVYAVRLFSGCNRLTFTSQCP